MLSLSVGRPSPSQPAQQLPDDVAATMAAIGRAMAAIDKVADAADVEELSARMTPEVILELAKAIEEIESGWTACVKATWNAAITAGIGVVKSDGHICKRCRHIAARAMARKLKG